MKIARVFPRKTKATPSDSLTFFGGPGLFPPEVDQVHVSVTFTYDINRAEILADEWKNVAPTTIGGPALGTRGEEFTPGLYIANGYTITSRGCPNRCWFCSVPKRDGSIRELEIKSGWNILDDNLLACSDNHIKSVFEMLSNQKEKAQFTGGLEAKRLKPWHVELLQQLKPNQMFFAYDTPDDYEPLVSASKMLQEAGFNRHTLRVYILIGWPKDTLEKAEARLKSVMNLGMCPMAMLWRNKTGETTPQWRKFARLWIRPACMYKKEEKKITNTLFD